MTIVQFKSEISMELDQLLAGVAQLDTSDLEQFLLQVGSILAQRKAPSLPLQELELLQKINQVLPEETQQQYDELSAKLRAEIITPQEHQSLLKLIDIVEQANCDRLQHLIQLSQLRNISLNELMAQLEIHHPEVHV